MCCMYAIIASNFVSLTMFAAPSHAHYFYLVTCVFPVCVCAPPSSRFPLRLRMLNCLLGCRFDVGIYSMCCELRINTMRLLTLGIRVRVVGSTLCFSICFGARFFVLWMQEHCEMRWFSCFAECGAPCLLKASFLPKCFNFCFCDFVESLAFCGLCFFRNISGASGWMLNSTHPRL
jgi:hypothetical protein